jgi:hypothetical protein
MQANPTHSSRRHLEGPLGPLRFPFWVAALNDAGQGDAKLGEHYVQPGAALAPRYKVQFAQTPPAIDGKADGQLMAAFLARCVLEADRDIRGLRAQPAIGVERQGRNASSAALTFIHFPIWGREPDRHSRQVEGWMSASLQN